LDKKILGIVIGAVGGVIATGIGVYAYMLQSQMQPYTDSQTYPGSPTYTEPAPSQPYSQQIVQDSIRIEPSYYYYYTFSTPNAMNIRLIGTVGVTGGVVPQILVYVMDSAQCPPASGNNFNIKGCNSYYISSYYQDGGTVDIYLPSSRTFYLAFENDAVLGESKTVDASFRLESQ
jgi:hypothetical protein